jgi:hypothetical protein
LVDLLIALVLIRPTDTGKYRQLWPENGCKRVHLQNAPQPLRIPVCHEHYMSWFGPFHRRQKLLDFIAYLQRQTGDDNQDELGLRGSEAQTT